MNPKGQWFSCGKDAPIGYYPRIFVLGSFEARFDAEFQPTKVEEAHQWLVKQSMWRGSDKHWDSELGEWWGYEVHVEKYETCIQYLTEMLGEPIDQQKALGCG